MYEEVEINSSLELARYLINVGDLYVGDVKVRIGASDSGGTHGCESNPFEAQTRDDDIEGMGVYWQVGIFTYYKKLNWHDCIPEGKKGPCYVREVCIEEALKARRLKYIVKHCFNRPAPFVDSDGMSWDYATPIPADELWVPEL